MTKYDTNVTAMRALVLIEVQSRTMVLKEMRYRQCWTTWDFPNTDSRQMLVRFC